MGERNAGVYKNKKIAILREFEGNSKGLVIRDGEVFISEDFHLPYTPQHTQHQGMLFLFSLIHVGTSVSKLEGLQSLCLLKWQLHGHPTRTNTLSLISNYFQSPRQNVIEFLYQKMWMSQLNSGKKHAFPTPSPMAKTPDRNTSP